MLQPGEEGTITIPRYTKLGQHLFTVVVESNDPVEPVKEVYLSFEIMPDA